jgi:hypothetical protein
VWTAPPPPPEPLLPVETGGAEDEEPLEPLETGVLVRLRAAVTPGLLPAERLCFGFLCTVRLITWVVGTAGVVAA